MKTKNKLLRITVLSVLVALGVVISPILRFEGMCPMAHFINIVCAVLLGPFESLLFAVLIGIIRMIFLGIPPIALTGAIFGAFLSGVFYKASKGKLLLAVLGEIVGTGIIGAIASYPVMTFLWGREGLSWLFYVPSFICGTLIGGSIAFVFLRKLSNSGLLTKFQQSLGSQSYNDKSGLLGSAVTIGTLGVISFIVIKVLTGIFEMTEPVWNYLAFGVMGAFIAAGICYYFVQKLKERKMRNTNRNPENT